MSPIDSTQDNIGPIILLNDAPLPAGHEFDALPSEEAGLMSEEDAFYYDRNYNQKRQLLVPLLSLLSSLRRGRRLGSSVHKQSDTVSSSPKRGMRKFGLTALIILALFGIFQLYEISQNVLVAFLPGMRHHIISSWRQIGKDGSELEHWPTDFTRDVIPINCHSHNDYWRAVPLYSGLSAGCISTEADVWLRNGELYIGPDRASLTNNRTLESLYIAPLLEMLEKQNPSTSFVPDGVDRRHGVFSSNPAQVFTLLVDLKTDENSTFAAVVDALQPLREKGYLTHFDGRTIVERPIRVVGTGNTHLSTVKSSRNEYRDVFMDAPIRNMYQDSHSLGRQQQARIESAKYSPKNSYYASSSFQDAVGTMWGWSLSNAQLRTLRGQIRGAHTLGLKVRYWNLPAWPVSRRNALWKVLIEEGVDILNVDDLEGAAHQDWGS